MTNNEVLSQNQHDDTPFDETARQTRRLNGSKHGSKEELKSTLSNADVAYPQTIRVENNKQSPSRSPLR